MHNQGGPFIKGLMSSLYLRHRWVLGQLGLASQDRRRASGDPGFATYFWCTSSCASSVLSKTMHVRSEAERVDRELHPMLQ